jgi:hypothetical protein
MDRRIEGKIERDRETERQRDREIDTLDCKKRDCGYRERLEKIIERQSHYFDVRSDNR